MDPKTLQGYYLKALYTDITRTPIDDPEYRYLMAHVDTERLHIERAARLRNLRTSFWGEMRLLNRFVNKEQLLTYVQGYAASPDFWKYRGRTLMEDFAIYLSSRADCDEGIALAARIEGVYSGLSTRSLGTPWAGHEFTVQSHESVESFFSASRIDWKNVYSDEPRTELISIPCQVHCVLDKKKNLIRIKFKERHIA